MTQFNDVRDQLNKLADDSSFNGINLLRGDKLKLNFNETSTSSITIQSKNANGINTTTLEHHVGDGRRVRLRRPRSTPASSSSPMP